MLDPRAKVAWEPAGDRAREKTKAEAAVRVEDKERDKAGGDRPEYFRRNILKCLQHWEAA